MSAGTRACARHGHSTDAASQTEQELCHSIATAAPLPAPVDMRTGHICYLTISSTGLSRCRDVPTQCPQHGEGGICISGATVVRSDRSGARRLATHQLHTDMLTPYNELLTFIITAACNAAAVLTCDHREARPRASQKWGAVGLQEDNSGRTQVGVFVLKRA